MTSGSAGSALERRESCLIDDAGALQHLYRAMAWSGEELDDDPAEVHYPRRIKDRNEEKAFAKCRDLFRELDVDSLDTTPLLFTGEGGECLCASAVHIRPAHAAGCGTAGTFRSRCRRQFLWTASGRYITHLL